MTLSRQNFSRITILVFLSVAAWYVVRHLEEFEALRHVRFVFLWPIVVCMLIQNAVNGYMNKEFVRYFDVELNFTEWFGLAALGAMGNYIAPFRGGTAGKAIYLKKKHDLSYTRFTTLFVAGYLLIFFLGGVLGALTIMGIYLKHGFLEWRLFVFFIALSLATVLFVPVFSRFRPPQGRFWGKISEAITGWKTISADKSILGRICCAIVINYFLTAVQIYYAFICLDIPISITAAWIIGLLSALGLILSITPGNLGVQEAMIGFMATLFGIGFNQGVMAQGIIRVAAMAVVFSLGPLYSYLLARL